MKQIMKQIVAVILVVSLCTSCSLLKPNPLKTKRVIKELEAEEYKQVDVDDVVDAFEDFANGKKPKKDFQNGVFAVAESKNEIKSVFRDWGGMNVFSQSFDYDKHMENACVFTKMQDSSSFTSMSGYVMYFICVEFDSHKSADKYLSDTSDGFEEPDSFEELGVDYEYDYDEVDGIRYVVLKGSLEEDGDDYYFVFGAYASERYLCMLISIDINTSKGERAVDDICDLVGIVSPNDI